MKKLLSHLLILATFCFFILGCKKEKVNPYKFLTSKNWKLAHVDKNPSTNPSEYVSYAPIADCNSDDIYKFNSDGTYTINPDANKCGDEQIRVSKYDIANKEIYVEGNKFPLYEVSENQIKFGMTIPMGTGWSHLIFLLE